MALAKSRRRRRCTASAAAREKKPGERGAGGRLRQQPQDGLGHDAEQAFAADEGADGSNPLVLVVRPPQRARAHPKHDFEARTVTRRRMASSARRRSWRCCRRDCTLSSKPVGRIHEAQPARGGASLGDHARLHDGDRIFLDAIHPRDAQRDAALHRTQPPTQRCRRRAASRNAVAIREAQRLSTWARLREHRLPARAEKPAVGRVRGERRGIVADDAGGRAWREGGDGFESAWVASCQS